MLRYVLTFIVEYKVRRTDKMNGSEPQRALESLGCLNPAGILFFIRNTNGIQTTAKCGLMPNIMFGRASDNPKL